MGLVHFSIPVGLTITMTMNLQYTNRNESFSFGDYTCLEVPLEHTIQFNSSELVFRSPHPSLKTNGGSTRLKWSAPLDINGLTKSIFPNQIKVFVPKYYTCTIESYPVPTPIGNPNNFEFLLSIDSSNYLISNIRDSFDIVIQLNMKNHTFKINKLFSSSDLSIDQPIKYFPSTNEIVKSTYNYDSHSIGSKFNVTNQFPSSTHQPMISIYKNSTFLIGYPMLGNSTQSTYYTSYRWIEKESISTLSTLNLNKYPLELESNNSTFLIQNIKLPNKTNSALTLIETPVNEFGMGTMMYSIQWESSNTIDGEYKMTHYIGSVLNTYPFSYSLGNVWSHKTSVSFFVNAHLYQSTYFQTTYAGGISIPRLTIIDPDTIPPEIKGIDVVPLSANKYLFRVHATDPSGIYFIRLEFFTTLEYTSVKVETDIYPQDLVSGSISDGVFEKIVDNIYFQIPSNIYIYMLDLSSQQISFHEVYNINLDRIPKLPPVFDLIKQSRIEISKDKMISQFKFKTNQVDLSSDISVSNLLQVNFTLKNEKQPPKLVLIRSPLTTNILTEFEGIWNDTLQLYVIDFILPPRLFSGKLNYYLMVPPFLYYDYEIEKLFNSAESSIVNIFCNESDLLPPMVSNIKVFPSNNIISGSTENLEFGWELEISDYPNGFKDGLIEVTSDFDFEPFVFNFTVNNRTNGDQYKGVYRIVLNSVLDRNFRSTQVFRITKIELTDNQGLVSSNKQSGSINPLIEFNSVMVDQNSINITCTDCSPTSITFPEIYNFIVSSDTIDVTAAYHYQRMVNFTIMVRDMETGISQRKEHSPTIYLQSTAHIITSMKSTMVFNNGTHARYLCNFEIPYGFGVGQGIIVSVYGIVNQYLNMNGYSANDLSKGGFSFSIKTLSSMTPLIESASTVNSLDQHLTLFGRGFGSKGNDPQIQIEFDNGVKKIVPNGKIQSGLILSSLFTPYIGINPFKIRVIVNGTESNPFRIIPNIVPMPTTSPTSSPTPSPTSTPPTCLGNPICGGSSQGE
eukprot:gene11728-14354_t